MKRVAFDLLILILIATPVTALMLFSPRGDISLERNWGTVVFSPPVNREDAVALADAMVTQGIFAGNQVALKLAREGDEWTLMMASKRDYEKTVSREMMAAIGYELCSVAFPGRTASFVLIDADMRPFELLVPPTRFPEF